MDLIATLPNHRILHQQNHLVSVNCGFLFHFSETAKRHFFDNESAEPGDFPASPSFAPQNTPPSVRPHFESDLWPSVFCRASLSLPIPPSKSASTSASKTRLVGVKMS